MMSKKDFKFVKKESNLDLEQTRVSLTYWQDVWRRLKKNKMAMFGLLIVISIVLFAIFGPLFTKFDYKDQELLLRNLPPKLDVYEVEDNVFIHRTEAYNLIEFNKDGYVVDLLQQVTIDEANDIYYYSYVKEFEYLLVEGGEFPLPDGVTFEPDTFYSEVWGIALTDVLTDVLTDDGDNQVIINYVHPDSPFLAGNQTNGSVAETIEGLVVDQFVFTDDISNPELADNYTIKSSRTYKGKETTKITDTFSNKTYPWGTDFLGRDVLTRVMYGARISLLVALIATLVNFLIGITFGSISGFFGGNVDNVMMRIVDIINSIPLVLYVILLMVVLREVVIDVDIFGKNRVIFNGADGFTTIIIALGSVYWTGMARLVRGQVLSLKEQEYVLAARTIGVSNRKIIYRHLIPNALGPIIVSMTMMIPSAVFTEAFLSFIGIGVSAPQASWGTLANEALGGITRYTYQLVYPSMAIAITMLGFNFLGDGLRDALDPRLRKG
jgi:oligopeptide transport system permease protein